MKCSKCNRDIPEERKACVYCGTSIYDGDWVETKIEMSIEKALSLLEGFRHSFNNGQINTNNYNRLVLDVIKDYIIPMNDREKINFAADGIVDSEFNKYLNDEIRKELRSFVIKFVSNNKKFTLQKKN